MGAIISNIWYAVVLIILFGITIFVHELGHFLVALKCGLVVDTFAIGFGPAIWKKKVRGIVYKIGCIPFGGYVALPQLDPSGMSTVQGKGDDGDGNDEPRRVLKEISPWKKVLVSLAGAGGNLILAVVLAWIVFLSPGAVTEPEGAYAGHVSTNSPAYAAGLRTGDLILSVNGTPVATWNEVSVECHLSSGSSNRVLVDVRSGGETTPMTIPTSEVRMGVKGMEGVHGSVLCLIRKVEPGGPAQESGLRAGDIVSAIDGQRVVSSGHFVELVKDKAGVPLAMAIERSGKPLPFTVTPRYDAGQDKALAGVYVENFGVMPWMQYKQPLDQIRFDASQIVRILRALTLPRTEGERSNAANALGGPVMILTMLWLSIKASILNGIGFLRFLNINLAILNLLPIPVLDGGHIMFSIWEGITRRKIHPRIVNGLVNTFAVLLIIVFLLLTRMDVLRLWRERKARTDAENERPAVTNVVQEEQQSPPRK